MFPDSVNGTIEQLDRFIEQYRKTQGSVTECQGLIAQLRYRKDSHEKSLELMRGVFSQVLEQQQVGQSMELDDRLRTMREIIGNV